MDKFAGIFSVKQKMCFHINKKELRTIQNCFSPAFYVQTV